MSNKPTNALFLSGIWLHRLQACLDWPDDSSSVHHSSLLSPCWLPHVCPQVTTSKNGCIWPDTMQWYLGLDLFVYYPFQPALWVPGRCLCCWPWQSKRPQVRWDYIQTGCWVGLPNENDIMKILGLLLWNWTMTIWASPSMTGSSRYCFSLLYTNFIPGSG